MKDKIIDCEDKYCAECGVRVVKPPRRKYCSDECAKKAYQKQQAEYWQKKYGSRSLESSLESSSKVDRSLLNETSLVLTANQFPMDVLVQAFHQALEPLFFPLNQRLVEITDRQNMIDIKFDELQYTLQQDPEFRRRVQWEQRSIQQAKSLLQKFENTLRLHQIRIILEDTLHVSKPTAERILKAAREQLQRDRTKNQRRLDDWEGAS